MAGKAKPVMATFNPNLPADPSLIRAVELRDPLKALHDRLTALDTPRPPAAPSAHTLMKPGMNPQSVRQYPITRNPVLVIK